MKYILMLLIGLSLPILMEAQCDQPYALQADSLTPYSAYLSWTPGGDESYWGFEWGLDGFVLGEGTRIDSLEEPNYSLANLTAETSYDYYVWAICDGDTSTWAGLEFMTLPRNNMPCSADTLLIDNTDTTYYINNINAIPSGPQASCWGNHEDGDLWYVFELPEASGVEIRTIEVSSNDSHIALYQLSGCDEEELTYTELACSEDSSNINWMSYIITEELEAGTYYIQCGTWNGAAGVYEILLNSVAPIVLPPNNDCSGATISTVVVDGATITVNGDGTNATDENEMGAAHVWEAFTIDTCADVFIDFCGSNPGPIILFSTLHDTCPVESIAHNGILQTDVCDDGNDGMNFYQVEAGTYYYPVVADDGIGGYQAYTMNITASSCIEIPQPDTCTTWINGPWGDFNYEFGGAPSPDSLGECAIYQLNDIAIYASESYEVGNFVEGIEYSVSVCDGEGAGSWPVEIAIIDTSGVVVAYEESCIISFIAPYDGTLYVGFNEVDACGESSDNTSTGNGYLTMSCGDINLSDLEIEKPEFKLYPNPNSGTFIIENSNKEGVYELGMFSMSGQMLWSDIMHLSNGQRVSKSFERLDSGLYLFKLTDVNDGSYSIQQVIIK